jgi:Pregnancy-associated plasma protein-A
MKRFSFITAAAVLFFAACSKNNSDKLSAVPEPENKTITQRQCASYDVLQANLKADPGLQRRMDEIEAFTSRYMQNPGAFRLLTDGTMEVPVVVNVLYNTAAENISDLQIQSQIDVLNEDFAGTNADVNATSTYQTVKAGDSKIRFVLQAIIRKSTTVTSWGTNDAMKKTSQGGIDPTTPATTLNLWSCNIGNGILGYAQFPGGSLATDGVVILYSAFGSRAKYPAGTYTNTYDLGRTASHEIGHYFNLRHIWGDRRCGDDFVSDTPGHDGANYGCPAANTISKCSGRPVEMTMNYMDYTDDRCMYMFSKGQATRMQATYAVGGPRATLR